jgi:hypothetical protein
MASILDFVLLLVNKRTGFSSRNNQHYLLVRTSPLFYILGPTCFGNCLPHQGASWVRLSYLLTSWPYGPLTALASLVTYALSIPFCRHLLHLIDCRSFSTCYSHLYSGLPLLLLSSSLLSVILLTLHLYPFLLHFQSIPISSS